MMTRTFKPTSPTRQTLTAIVSSLLLLATVQAALGDADTGSIKQKIAERLPGVTVDHIVPSPVKGIYEVGIDGSDVVYISADGRYFFSGPLVDMITRENLTERVRAEQRVKILKEVPEKSMIIFEPNAEVKHTLTIFTDIDCPFCRKLHREMPLLNRMGIRVRYMFFPRAGIGSDSYEKAVSVWCADNQQAEMTLAKSGKVPELRDCDNPVRQQMALARRLGLRGTPYLITETGRTISGYVPAPELFESLEADKDKPVQ